MFSEWLDFAVLITIDDCPCCLTGCDDGVDCTVDTCNVDTQLGSDGARQGVRMLASFRAQDGALCRVFTATTTSGIACRDGNCPLITTVP